MHSSIVSSSLPKVLTEMHRGVRPAKLGKIGTLFALASLTMPSIASSEVLIKEQDGKTVTTTQSNRAKPSEDACHTIEFGYKNSLGLSVTRRVGIHTGDNVQAGTTDGPYYLMSIPALIKAVPERRVPGVPAIVHDVREANDGTNNLVFTFFSHVSNRNLLDYAAHELQLKYDNAGPFDVRAWPVTGVVVECFVEGGQADPIAVTYRGDIEGFDNFTFSLNMNETETAQFLSASEDGSLRMSYHFFYLGAMQSQINQEANVMTNATGKLIDLMESRRWIGETGEPQRPLLAHEKQDLDELVETVYKENVRVKMQAGAEGVLALYDASVAQTILRIAKPTDTSLTELLSDSVFREALQERLTPMVNRTYSSKEDKDITVTVKQTENIQSRGKNSSLGFNIGIDLEYVDFGVDIGEERERQAVSRVLDRIERQTGIRYVESSEKSVYVPERIEAWSLATLDSTRNVFFDSFKTISVGTDGYTAPITIDISLDPKEELLYNPEEQLVGLQAKQKASEAEHKLDGLVIIDKVEREEVRQRSLSNSISTLEDIILNLESSHREYVTTLSSLAGDNLELLSEESKALIADLEFEAERAKQEAEKKESDKEEAAEEQGDKGREVAAGVASPTTQYKSSDELRSLLLRAGISVTHASLEREYQLAAAKSGRLELRRDDLLSQARVLTERTNIFTTDYLKLKSRQDFDLNMEIIFLSEFELALDTYQARMAWKQGLFIQFTEIYRGSAYDSKLPQIYNAVDRSCSESDANKRRNLISAILTGDDNRNLSSQIGTKIGNYIKNNGPIPGGRTFEFPKKEDFKYSEKGKESRPIQSSFTRKEAVK